MTDLPKRDEIPDTANLGTKIITKPKTKNEQGKIVVTIPVENGSKIDTYKFTFETDLETIKARQTQIWLEIEQKTIEARNARMLKYVATIKLIYFLVHVH